MTNFFVIKDKLTRFYKIYEAYFQIAFKFLVAFFVFGFVNDKLGYYPVLSNAGIQLVLALISAIIPSSVFVLLVAIVALLHLYKLSLVMMILAFVVFVVFYFLYLKFAPRHGVLMMVIPLLMPLNLHFIVPLIAGLFFSPFTIVPIASSFILVKIVKFIIEAAAMLDGGKMDIEAIVAAYQYVIDHVLDDKEMLLYGVVFAVMVVLTYVVSRFPFDYAWYVGIGLGAVAGIVGLLVGSGMLSVDVSAGGVIIGCIASGLIVSLIQFLRCTVDYARKEKVQFEDDDYYYYVKAIPKIKSAVAEPSGRALNETKNSDFKDSLKQMFSKDEDEEDFNEDFDDVFEQEDMSLEKSVPGRARASKASKQKPSRLKSLKEKGAKGIRHTEDKTPEADVLLSDKTQIFDQGDNSVMPEPEKQPDIIIPELKLPPRSVPKAEPVASRVKTPEVPKPKKEVPKKPEKKVQSDRKPARMTFDYDFDDDGYDDSMEDYGSDDSDFGKF